MTSARTLPSPQPPQRVSDRRRGFGVRRPLWWLALAVYFPTICLEHLNFSLWLVKGRTITLAGQLYVYAFSQAVPWLAISAVVWWLYAVLRQARLSPNPWPNTAAWCAWIVSVVAVDQWLTYSVNEYAHYPQYGLLAWMLAQAMDPHRTDWPVVRILFWVTLGGAADELMQYLWITRSYSHYMDFNDILVNLLAGAAGILVHYGFRQRPSRNMSWLRWEKWVLCSLLLLFSAGLWSGHIAREPSARIAHPIQAHPVSGWQFFLQTTPQSLGASHPGKRHATFYVMTPEQGAGAVILAFLFFSALCGAPWPESQRTRPSCHPREGQDTAAH